MGVCGGGGVCAATVAEHGSRLYALATGSATAVVQVVYRTMPGHWADLTKEGYFYGLLVEFGGVVGKSELEVSAGDDEGGRGRTNETIGVDGIGGTGNATVLLNELWRTVNVRRVVGLNLTFWLRDTAVELDALWTGCPEVTASRSTSHTAPSSGTVSNTRAPSVTATETLTTAAASRSASGTAACEDVALDGFAAPGVGASYLAAGVNGSAVIPGAASGMVAGVSVNRTVGMRVTSCGGVCGGVVATRSGSALVFAVYPGTLGEVEVEYGLEASGRTGCSFDGTAGGQRTVVELVVGRVVGDVEAEVTLEGRGPVRKLADQLGPPAAPYCCPTNPTRETPNIIA